MTRTHREKAQSVALAILVLCVFLSAGAVGISGADVTYFDVTTSSTIAGGSSFEYYVNSPNATYVVLDENGNGDFDSGEPYITETATGGTSGEFPGSQTENLEDRPDDTYEVYALDKQNVGSLDDGTDLSIGASDTISVDGSAPYVSEVNVTNPSGQDVTVSFTTNEQLNETTVDLSVDGSGSATFGLGDFTETNDSGTYTYELTHAGSSDGDYTAEVTRATDIVGNDAAVNQSAGELTDSVTVDTVPPGIDSVEAEVGSDTVTVTFNQTVEAADGSALSAANFTYGNAESGGATAVSSVSHTAGSTTATLTLDASISRTDLGNDTVAAASGDITDGFGNTAPTTAVPFTDTNTPIAPVDASGHPINASNDENYDLTVTLPDDHEAGTLAVDLSNGDTVTASQYVTSEDDGDGDPHEVSFTGLDVSSLDNGTVTVDATLTDDGGNDAAGTGLASITKDADRPRITDATITNSPIGTYDAGSQQTVTVDFDEPVDDSVAPTVTITGLNRTYTVSGGGFADDNQTWTGTVTILDDNEDATARIEVSGVEDTVGNRQTPDPDDSSTFQVDTTGPAKPEDTLAGAVTASNGTNYNVTVDLVADSQADEVEVRVSDGTDTVTASTSTGGSDLVTVTGIDVSTLGEGTVTVSARALDGGYANTEGFVEPVDVIKDTNRPGVASVSVGDGTVNDSDAGSTQAVTVTFDEDVDQTVAPTVELTGLAQSYDATGSFTDARTWTGTVTIADDEEEDTATVAVSGVRDLVGNLQTPDPDNSGSVQVDTITPTISNVAATHTGDGTVELSFDSDETLTDVAVDVTGPEPKTLTDADFTESSGTYTATFNAADGDYTATLTTAEDAAGNDGATDQTDTATVDTTAPVFSALSPAGTTETTDQPTLSVDVSDATEGVNVSSIRVTVADSDTGDALELNAATTDTTGISYSDGTLTVDTSTAGVSLAEGGVDVTVEANDTVDNANATTFSFTVDTVAPQFSNASPAGETVTDNQSVITVDVSDATAGVDASSIAVTLEDDTGSAFLSNAGTGTDGVSFDGTTLTVDPTGADISLPNGTVTVNVLAADAVANTDSTEFAFEVDVPPTISGFSAADTEGRNATVSFESTDELDAVQVAVSGAETATLDAADFSATADGDGFVYEAVYEGSTDGTYDFELQTASDGRTDSAAFETASALVDEAAPDVTLDAPNGGELFRGSETVTVAWTATDNVSVATDSVVIDYSTDGGSTWTEVAAGLTDDGSYDWTVPTVDSSDVLVRVSADDTSSNTGTDASDAAFTVDSTAPGISNYAVTNPDGQNVTVSFDSAEELDALSVAVSNATTRTLDLSDFAVSGSGPYTYTATFDGGAEGTYDTTLDAAVDAAGNDGATTESGSVAVDTVTPTVSAFTATNPSGQTVNVSFESDERLATAEVSLVTPSGTTTFSSFTETGSGPYTYYATAGGEDGDYTATLVAAADDHGNDAADSQEDSVTVDTTPPTVSNYTVTNPTGQQVRVHFDADEPIDTVSVAITGAESATITTDNPTVVDGSYVVTYAGNADGTYTATLAGAVDASGNDGGGDSASTTIQTAAPIISGFTASNPEAQNVTVSFGSDEPLANVTVDISGAETATLTEANFTENGDTYTATYVGASNGTYTAVLQTAADADGDDGASGQTNSATVGTTAEPVTGPTVTNFSLANPTGRELRVSFDSSAVLADVGVAVTGPDTATLTTGAFNESDGTYTATVAVDPDGDYTATLFEATDGSGENGANSESDAVTVDTSTGDAGGGSGGPVGGQTAGGSSNTGGPPTPTGPSVSVTATGTSEAAIAVEDADAGESLSVALDNATSGPVGVTGLNVTTSESMDYSMAVSTSTDAASGSPSFDGRAVGFLDVAHSFADADVERATVTVQVAAERFEDTDLYPSDTTVYRYHDGAWQALDTRVVGQDDDAYTLEAETPGFSVFAVGVRDADVVRVSGASVTASASEVGEPVAVSATVENTAAYRANVTLTVVANGSTVASKLVSVAAADTATTTLDVVFDAPGDYRLAVGNTAAGTLAVSERASSGTTTPGDGTPGGTNTTSSPTPTAVSPTGDATTATGESSDGDVPGPGVLGGLLAAVLAALVATRWT